MRSNEESFVFYESFLDSITQAEKFGKGLEMAKAILNYGLYGIEPEVTPENESICMSLAQISNDIDRAQLRREKNIADGQTGGRPTVSVANQDLIDFLESGRTQEEAAKKWGVSLRTIQRRVRQYKDAQLQTGNVVGRMKKNQVKGAQPIEEDLVKSEGEMELAVSRLRDPETGTWEF